MCVLCVADAKGVAEGQGQCCRDVHLSDLSGVGEFNGKTGYG